MIDHFRRDFTIEPATDNSLILYDRITFFGGGISSELVSGGRELRDITATQWRSVTLSAS
jgi:hypothetical protein